MGDADLAMSITLKLRAGNAMGVGGLISAEGRPATVLHTNPHRRSKRFSLKSGGKMQEVA
jgi:hypothetical protein